MPTRRFVVGCGDPDLQRRVVEILTGAGAQLVRQAATGEETLLACATEGADLAIVDEALPGISGSSVAEILEEMDRSVQTVVLHRGELPEDAEAIDVRSGGLDRALLRAVELPRRSENVIRVFVVDDHETVRLGLRTLFDLEPGMVVVGDA